MSQWPVDRLRALSGIDDVEQIIDPLDVVLVGRDEREPLQPRTILRFGGAYLVEADGDGDNWYMGSMHEGELVCWGQYGSLERAIRAL